jgi:hypothetical protein
MLGLKSARKGCLGCLGAASALVVLAVLVWLFAPGVVDGVVDWMLYVDPPHVAVTPNGAAEVKSAMRDIYTSVEGDAPPKRTQVVLSEGAMNGLLGDPSDGSALREARVDLGDDAATLYAAVDLGQLSRREDYRDLLPDVPSFLRDRRVSVRVSFTGLTTARERLTFEDVDVKVGRVWVPEDLRFLQEFGPDPELAAEPSATEFRKHLLADWGLDEKLLDGTAGTRG